jgi:hypothetical protein
MGCVADEFERFWNENCIIYVIPGGRFGTKWTKEDGFKIVPVGVWNDYCNAITEFLIKQGYTVFDVCADGFLEEYGICGGTASKVVELTYRMTDATRENFNYLDSHDMMDYIITIPSTTSVIFQSVGVCDWHKWCKQTAKSLFASGYKAKERYIWENTYHTYDYTADQVAVELEKLEKLDAKQKERQA